MVSLKFDSDFFYLILLIVLGIVYSRLALYNGATSPTSMTVLGSGVFLFVKTASYFVISKPGFELEVLLPLHLECWNYRSSPSCLASF